MKAQNEYRRYMKYTLMLIFLLIVAAAFSVFITLPTISREVPECRPYSYKVLKRMASEKKVELDDPDRIGIENDVTVLIDMNRSIRLASIGCTITGAVGLIGLIIVLVGRDRAQTSRQSQ